MYSSIRADAASYSWRRAAHLDRQEPREYVSPHLPSWPVGFVQYTKCMNILSGSDWAFPFIGYLLFLLMWTTPSPPSPHFLFFSNPLGLLSYHIPEVEPRDLDFSNSHGAVSATPPAATLVSGDPWYPWYSWKQPRERELSRLRRLYQGHLQEESGPPPTSIPEVPLTTGAEASIEEAGPRSAL